MSAYRRSNRSSRSVQFTSYGETNSENSIVESSENISVNCGPDTNSEYTIMGQYENGESSTKRDQTSSDSNDDTQSEEHINLELITSTSFVNEPASYQPKHIRFPDVPYNSELVNEFMIFAYTLIATAMQFLHLYRTVWWLPESNTNQAMNFYLIDEHLTMFIVILLGRRAFYCILVRVLELMSPQRFFMTVIKFMRFIFFAGILLMLGYLSGKIFEKQRYIVIYLCYPMIVYLITFGFKVEPFLRTIFESESPTYFNGIPSHSCSTNPAIIRAEIDVLRTDYINRFKQVVFTSLLNAYFAAFIPCCFAQNYLYYDLYWSTQHLGFSVLGGFTMCIMFCFPANYCDVMHMASLHLGKWMKVESRSYVPPTMSWSKQEVWPSGTLVKYSGDLYKAYGVVTTAIPGNGVHIRFHIFFQNPANIYFILSIIQTAIVILQIIILLTAVEWYNIISLSYLLLANYHTLFRILRDFFVSHRMYSSEHEKPTMSTLFR